MGRALCILVRSFRQGAAEVQAAQGGGHTGGTLLRQGLYMHSAALLMFCFSRFLALAMKSSHGAEKDPSPATWHDLALR